MANLMHSARLLVSDLASTFLFLVVLLITKDLMLAVGLGVGLGIVQIAWMKAIACVYHAKSCAPVSVPAP